MNILLSVLPSCLICVHRFISMILISYLSLPVSFTWTAVFIYSYILPEYAWTFVLQVCQGSLCKRIGYTDSIADTFTPSWDECYISGGSDVESRKKMCYLACQKGKKKPQCVRVRGFPHIIHVKNRHHY